METKDLGKTKKIAGIVSIVLAIVLIAGIVVSVSTKAKLLKESITIELGSVSELTLEAEDFFETEKEVTFDVSGVDVSKVGTYEAYAHLSNRKYSIEVIVADTTAPKAIFKERCIFTNDIAAMEDFSAVLENVEEASEYTVKLIRFEKEEDLCEINEKKMENLLAKLGEESEVAGSMEVPTTEGIYRSVLALEDAEGNVSYEEVYVILDTTGALIDEVEDLVFTVSSKSKLSEEPELDLEKYIANDNVDGYLTSDDLKIELVEKDSEKHEWITRVSYIDRAGNESVGEFLITVEVKAQATSNRGTGSASQSGTGYHPADTNRDGMVDGEEDSQYIDANEQACLNAGIGVVVPVNGGTAYMVVVHKSDVYSAVPILSNYLNSIGMTGNISSYSGNGTYEWAIADNLVPVSSILTPDDPGFWDY